MANAEDNKALIDEVEALYDKKNFSSMYDLLLPHKESKDANVLWRLAMAATEKGKELGGEKRKEYIFAAFEYAKEALKLDDNNFACHKWYGILLVYTTEYTGTKDRFSKAFLIKEHFLKVLELNPSDALTMHHLGCWCYWFANLSWYERKLANTLFASPPTSTYEEALKYFEDAEKAEPGFYNLNKLMRARAMIKLKADKEKIKELLLAVLDCKVVTKEDNEVAVKARAFLKEY